MYFQVWKNGEKRGVFSAQPLQMFISHMWHRSDSGGGGEQPYYGVLLWDRLCHLGIEGGNGKKNSCDFVPWLLPLASFQPMYSSPTRALEATNGS